MDIVIAAIVAVLGFVAAVYLAYTFIERFERWWEPIELLVLGAAIFGGISAYAIFYIVTTWAEHS